MTPSIDWQDKNILAPLTKGGNLPFRRLCAEFGADITISEMAYSRFLIKGEGREKALLRKHTTERIFGVQLAAKAIDEGAKAVRIAADAGADFVDINCGCPIHDTVRRGMGAHLLKKPEKLGRFIGELVKASPIPVTAKIRLGWSDEITGPMTARILEEAGVSALTVHGRTREQRYSRQANWDYITQIVSERSIPVIGNGDILTTYEAADRKAKSRCASIMIGRGALIKPWVFKELKSGVEWFPSAEERIAVYFRLTTFFKEHFREDEKGYNRTMFFLPWHFSFFHRYRPLPESVWGARAKEHPLIQSRVEQDQGLSLLDTLLADPRPETHILVAQELWRSQSSEEAVVRLTALASSVQGSAPTSLEEQVEAYQG